MCPLFSFLQTGGTTNLKDFQIPPCRYKHISLDTNEHKTRLQKHFLSLQEVIEDYSSLPGPSVIYSVLDFPKRPPTVVEFDPNDTEYAHVSYPPDQRQDSHRPKSKPDSTWCHMWLLDSLWSWWKYLFLIISGWNWVVVYCCTKILF